LSIEERTVRVCVHDDGIGIDRTATSRGGRGIEAMSARAEDNGGGLSIEAAPGGGTLLTWHIPVSIA
jgi:signal transduction histidine kinase